MLEMQRLVGDDGLRVSSVRSWKEILPKVLKQIELEATHNRGLREAITEINLTDKKGMLSI